MKKKAIIMSAAGIVILGGAVLAFLFFTGKIGGQVLARVNEEKITVERFNQEIAKVEEPYRGILKEDPAQFLEGMIVKTLVFQEAKKEGFFPPVKTYKDTGKDAPSPEEFLIAEFMKKKFSSPPEVTREEVEAFYSMFKDRMGGKPLKEVAPIIEQLIRETKQQETLGRFIEDLRKKAKVEIDQGRLQKIAAKLPESNTDEDFKNALKSGKPFLTDFGANSCLPCRQLRPILKEINNELSGKTRALVIDVYKYQDLAREYKVQLIPTLVFFDAKGKEVFRHVGVMDKEKIVAKLKEIGMET